MEQRISLVTLGVVDVARSRAFYEALGWNVGVDAGAEIAFFQVGPMVFSLWGREQLAGESGVEDSGGWGGVTLAHNVRSPEEVDAVLAEAEAAGGKIVKPGEQMFWGGYAGAFVDPDGHPWQIAHNPSWPLGEDGAVKLA
jgi:catechol 2,3-dioxygenase-like lactoylglutathione lyase family enzyme